MQQTEQVKTDFEKTMEPFKTLEKESTNNDKQIDITDPEHKTILDDYGLLESNINKKLPKSMQFEHSISFIDGKTIPRFYLGQKEIFPQPFRGLIFSPDKSPFNLDRNFVNLLRGADLNNYAVEDLIKYKAMLDRVGAVKSLRRYKQLENLLSTGVKVGKGLSEKQKTETTVFLPDDPQELLNRLNILISAIKEGHNSSFNEIHAILKRLLEKKILNEEDYKSIAEICCCF